MPRTERRGVPFAWLGLALLVAVASTLQKLPCLRGRVDTDVLATAQCYSDIPIFYTGQGLAAEFGWLGHLPPGYRNLEYPPLINLFIEASAKLTHIVSGLDSTELSARARLSRAELYDLPGMAVEERTFFLVSCLGLFFAVVVGVWAAWRAGWSVGDRVSWAMAIPILVFTLTLNWDVLALMFTVLALASWRRGHNARFGLWVALGTATKLFPLVLLASALILLVRTRSTRSLISVTSTFAVVTVAANAPLYFSNKAAWAEFWTTNTERPESFGSLWIAIRMVGLPVGTEALGLALALGMVASWVVLALLTWSGRIAPTLAELSFVFLLIFFALGKVYSPQYSLWVVLGLLLITRRRWLIALIAAVETFHYVATWLYIRGITSPDVGIDKTYWCSIVVRLSVEGLAVVAVLLGARKRAVSTRSAEFASGRAEQTSPA